MFIRLFLFLIMIIPSTVGLSQDCRVRFVWGSVVALRCGELEPMVKLGQTIPQTKLVISKIERISASNVEVRVLDRGVSKKLARVDYSSRDIGSKKENKKENREEPKKDIKADPSFTLSEQENTPDTLNDLGKKLKKNRSLDDWKLLYALEVDSILTIADLSEEEADQVLREAHDCSYAQRKFLAACIVKKKDNNEKQTKKASPQTSK